MIAFFRNIGNRSLTDDPKQATGLPSGVAYRREIDGLRALAVIPVVLFHAGIEAFKGGFVGVDVFFVISGYLITGIVAAELSQDKFSVIKFYERRARRILPALFTVIICCLPFAWAWMLPAQLKEFSQSVVAVVLFTSNVLFWQKDDYFGASAEQNPLLHTWSLGVEEQFYLLFPLALLLLWRFGARTVFWLLISAALLSFGLSEWASRNASVANFYLAPTRAWQLLTGSLCAFSIQKWSKSNSLSALGLLLIIAPIFLYDRSIAFPGVYALPPTAGAALIILFSDSRTWVGRILSTPPLVGVGLISYSAYLWHQPLFAFARIQSLTSPPREMMLALAAVALVLAYLSWRYVEQPFRKPGNLLPQRSAVFKLCAMVGGVLVSLGVYGHLQNGFASRSTAGPALANLDARLAPNTGLGPDCNGPFDSLVACQTSQRPKMVLWGDSYAMHLVPAIVASDANKSGLRQQTMSNCVPIFGASLVMRGFDEGWANRCIKSNDAFLEWLRGPDSAGVEYVVMSSAFGVLFNDVLIRDGKRLKVGNAERANLDLIADELARTVRAIQATGRKVVLISPTPVAAHDLGMCPAKAAFRGLDDTPCTFLMKDIKNSRAFELMDRIASSVPIIRLDQNVCAGPVCNPTRDGELLYRDAGHLSYEGSSYLGRKIGLTKLLKRKAE